MSIKIALRCSKNSNRAISSDRESMSFRENEENEKATAEFVAVAFHILTNKSHGCARSCRNHDFDNVHGVITSLKFHPASG